MGGPHSKGCLQCIRRKIKVSADMLQYPVISNLLTRFFLQDTTLFLKKDKQHKLKDK